MVRCGQTPGVGALLETAMSVLMLSPLLVVIFTSFLEARHLNGNEAGAGRDWRSHQHNRRAKQDGQAIRDRHPINKPKPPGFDDYWQHKHGGGRGR